MTNDTPKAKDEKEAERRFNEPLGRMLNTPHKAHAPLKPPLRSRRRALDEGLRLKFRREER